MMRSKELKGSLDQSNTGGKWYFCWPSKGETHLDDNDDDELQHFLERTRVVESVGEQGCTS